ncbi:MAG TPA: hypothetical protein VIU40_05815 [Geobacteraceae bacterium]
MEKQELISKTQEALSPLETQNIIQFFQTTTLQSILDNPLVLGMLVLVLFYTIIKRSKFMLLFLFSLLSLLLLVRYTFPSPENALDIHSTVPFVGGCLGISAVLLYFIFVKSE